MLEKFLDFLNATLIIANVILWLLLLIAHVASWVAGGVY